MDDESVLVVGCLREIAEWPWQTGAPCSDLVCDVKQLLAKYKEEEA
jgi:hypothetical protein